MASGLIERRFPTLDFETFSAAGFDWEEPSEKHPLGRWVAPQGAKEPGIAAVGAPVYAEHPSTEVLAALYDLDDGRGMRRWVPGMPPPRDLFEHVAQPNAELWAQNQIFDMLIAEGPCIRLYGWPPIPRYVWRCTKAQALVNQRPGQLEAMAEVLGLEQQKDKDGKRLLKKFSIPQQPIPGLVDKKTGRIKRPDQPARRILPTDDPEDFERLCVYGEQDVRTQMDAARTMPPLSPQEIEAWQATQAMNYAGLAVDRPGLLACIDILQQVVDRYGRECEETTGFSITQLEKLKGWLAAYGVHTASLDAEHLDALLERTDLHPTARRVLELRALTGSASVKKTFAIRNRLSADDRLRDIVVHHGTRPGRPTGEGPQPLNLPKAGPDLMTCPCGRPCAPQPLCPWCGAVLPATAKTSWHSDMVDHVLEIMSIGSLDLVERFFGDAMLAIQGCVRGLFVAGPGNRLVSTDYSSLQAVVAACLAGEQWRIDAFRRGDPIYLVGASKIRGRSVEEYLQYAVENGKHHPDRQLGKISELSLGFQGWVNAFRSMEKREGIDLGLSDDEIRDAAKAWRDASPMIVEMWGGQWRGPPWRREHAELHGLEGMFIAAVQNPGQTFTYRGIDFCMSEPDCMVMLLPPCDGHRRPLRYHEPILTQSHRNPDELSISYMTWNTNPQYGARGWVRMPTWGGRLFENAVMGVEVDIQRFGAKQLIAHGYPMVLSVYDEDVCEIPLTQQPRLGLPPIEGLDPYVQEIEHLLSIMPPEMADWPIKAAGGWAGRRYRK